MAVIEHTKLFKHHHNRITLSQQRSLSSPYGWVGGLSRTPVTGLIGKHLAPGNQSPAIPHIPPNTHARFPWQLWSWWQRELFGLQSEPDCSDVGRGVAVAASLLHGRQKEQRLNLTSEWVCARLGHLHQIWGAASKTDASMAMPFKTTTVLLKCFLHADVWNHQYRKYLNCANWYYLSSAYKNRHFLNSLYQAIFDTSEKKYIQFTIYTKKIQFIFNSNWTPKHTQNINLHHIGI